MKISKRMLAVLMAVVMILTIVPLGLFAFAGEEPIPSEPPQEEPKPVTHHITTLDQFNAIGTGDYLLTDNYVLDEDIICKDANLKFYEWFENEENAQEIEQEIGNITKLFPLYKEDEGTEYNPEISYYSFDEETETYTKVTFTEEITYAPATYFVENGYGPVSLDDFDKLPLEEQISIVDSLKKYKPFTDDECTINPVGVGAAFEGTFDGQNHEISGVKLEKKSGIYCGLFENNKGTIKNLKTNVNVDFYPNDNRAIFAGGIVAVNLKDAVIENCDFFGYVSVHFSDMLKNTENSLVSLNKTYIYAGGIAGISSGTIDEKCNADKAVVISDYAGGINVKLGQKIGTDNDINMFESMLDPETYDPDDYAKVVSDFTNLPGESKEVRSDDKYQLVSVYENEYSSLLYIRMLTCDHSNAEYHDAVASTCKVGGKAEYWECPDCGLCFATNPQGNIDAESFDPSLDVDSSAHKLEKIDAKPASCEKTGNKEYWKCSLCGKCFSDEAGTDNRRESYFTTAKLGHSWDEGKVTKEPTYDATGIKTYTCTREGCDATKTEKIAKLVKPSITAKSSSGYKAKRVSGKDTLILPNPSNQKGTTIASFKKNLESGYTYVIKDSKGKTVKSGPIGTNYTVEIKKDGQLFDKTIVIVRGDLDCDGTISAMDFVKIKNHIRRTNVISDPAILIAADANGDGDVIGALDYVRVKNVIRNSK